MNYHHQNLTDGRLPLWRHGRAWAGKANWEWCVGMRWKSAGIAIGKRGFYLSIPGFQLYLSHRDIEHLGPVWKLDWHDGAFWFSTPWEREMEWRSSDPWWRRGVSWNPADTLFGRWKCALQKKPLGTVWVPMPEGSYKAIATEETRTWTRRFGIRKTRTDVWLDFKRGIPHAGKGTCDYNCVDDGLYGIGGDSVEAAIGNAVRSVLRNRKRYGLDSAGTGREPAIKAGAA